ncbi:MAG TPA: hypothetical protein VEV84_12725, partial [Pyrinomonadaceae bacterium]|nr:hypothetical protein [Pyrinomonadaceae bacterium]
MTAKTPRPIFVSLSIVVLWLELILHIIGAYSFGSVVFSRGWIIPISFVFTVSMAVLILATIINVQYR